MNIDVDCLIVGGGPAGLTGAVDPGRFRRRALVIDTGGGRASLISKSHNFPGAAQGISGPALLENLREQARNYGVQMMTGSVEHIFRVGENFVAQGEGFSIRAAKILLATGVVDNAPPLAQVRKFIYEGGIRFCPVCDGYEYIGKTIGVLGPPNLAIPKSRFLRTYSDKVYLIPTEELNQDEKDELNQYQIRETGVATNVKTPGDKIVIETRQGSIDVDVLYPAFGFDVNSDLATKLGADVDGDGFIKVNINQMTTVEGLYAAGNVVMALSQISVATGQALSRPRTSINNCPIIFCKK